MKILLNDEIRELNITDGKSLSEILRENGIYLSSPCNGTGRCGKCRIRITEGEIPASPADLRILSENEINAGVRLACQIKSDFNATAQIINNEENMNVLGESEAYDADKGRHKMPDGSISDVSVPDGSLGFGIAIDIGTTTLAAALIDISSGRTIASALGINHQRSFGADVISRIQASNDGAGEQLKALIQNDLKQLISDLAERSGINPDKTEQIVIAGNTTMGHLLMGYPCSSLGVYPFTPYNIGKIEGSAEEILGIAGAKTKVTILPGISTYVGGDITAGLLSLGAFKSDKPIALIDLGTNGEMALGNKEKILVTSAAAGPAFEGGNISCGMGSVPGAVCGVTIRGEEAILNTIDGKPPIGLCGTGVVELTGEMLANGLIDETGLLDEDYEDEGYPFAITDNGEELFFTQKDVREIQLAKAAVRAGFETLLLRYGVTCDDLDSVYVAGGFGYFLDTKKAALIGLFPPKALPKLKAIGNSSLRGAVDYMIVPKGDEMLCNIIGVSEEIALSTDKDFNEIYVDSMMFTEE